VKRGTRGDGIARPSRSTGASDSRITPVESEAMKLLELTLQHGAELVRSIQTSHPIDGSHKG